MIQTKLNGKIVLKQCTKCHIIKPLDEFSDLKNYKYGKNSRCKHCIKEYAKKYREDNKELISINSKKYRENNREQLNEYLKVYGKKWRADHPEKVKEYAKKDYIKNKEQINKRHKKYRVDNSEKETKRYKKDYIKNKVRLKEKYEKYMESNKDKERLKRYIFHQNNKERLNKKQKEYGQTDAGKLCSAKHTAKRKRELGYVVLNDRFDGCEGHHIDTSHVIFIPKTMHKSNPHRQDKPETMIEINRLAINFLNERRTECVC